MQEDRNEFVVGCAMAARVMDGMLAHLMKDTRVALKYDELFETLCDDMRWLVDVDFDAVWSFLRAVCGQPGGKLRASCISGGHIAFHFFWRRVLEPAGELPWSLMRGDHLHNLEELAAGDKPDEPASQQFWHLMHRGHNRHQLVAALQLMADARWTSVAAEQQHGLAASNHRHHK